MSNDRCECHGNAAGLRACASGKFGTGDKFFWQVQKKIKTARKLGFMGTLRYLFSSNKPQSCAAAKDSVQYDEILGLKPGDVVEVKSYEEITATLDDKQRHKGLYWMPSITRFCGREMRVYKRLQRIMLESTGEFKNVKNAVILEDAICDGRDFYDCDRCCFYFWKEAWLRRK